MSKKENIKRVSRYKDAELKQVADKVLMLVQRDAADFAAYGIAPFDLADFAARIDLLANFSSDVLLESNKMIATKNKNTCREALEVIMRYFFTTAKFCFSTEPAILAAFGNASLAKQSSAVLICSARSLAAKAQLYWPRLAAAGLLPQYLQVLQTAITAFDDAVTQQIMATNARKVASSARVEAANALYALITKFCTYGKLLWRETDPTKYKHYLLY